MNIQSTYLQNTENMTFEEILAAIESSQEFPLSCVNWKEYPHAPQVSFHVAHTDKALVVLFDVKEDHVRAVSLEENGPVWEDSCVEIFLAIPGAEGYFNFETNCIGTKLASKRRSRTDADHFSDSLMDRIRCFGSMPHEPVDSEGREQSWWLAEMIPFELIGLDKAPESLRMNFYKCGDKTAHPHFLSWNPIDLPKPDFHRPEFFGELRFER